MPAARTRPTPAWRPLSGHSERVGRRLEQWIGLPFALAVIVVVGVMDRPLCGQESNLQAPVIQDLFPLGVQAGTSARLTLDVRHLPENPRLWTSHPDVTTQRIGESTFLIDVPPDVPPGRYDLALVGPHGMSAPRSFHISRRQEVVEQKSTHGPQRLDVNSIVSGRIGQSGETDHYEFTASAGQRVVIQCWAERIDSPLHAILQLHDAEGKRLHVDRGRQSLDPRIDFLVPEDGVYTITVHDLTFVGSQRHTYRLALDTGPHIKFARPSILERGKTNRVTLYGWNLSAEFVSLRPGVEDYESVEVDIEVPEDYRAAALPARISSFQAGIELLAYDYPGTNHPLLFRVTDVQVVVADTSGTSPSAPQSLAVPCEVSGQFPAGLGATWFSLTAERGEVLWLEGFGQRIGAPVDVDLVVLDETGSHELLHLSDTWASAGGPEFPTYHLDFAGRWVVPETGRYLLLVRNLHGDAREDPHDAYHLSIRREERDFQLVVVPPGSNNSATWNVPRGGRSLAEIIALRRLGMTDPIHVTAENLPPGLEIEEVWIGPDTDRAPLIARATDSAEFQLASPRLVGQAETGGVSIQRPVRAGIRLGIRERQPTGRLSGGVHLGQSAARPLAATAYPQATRIPQGGLVEVQVVLERRGELEKSVVELEGRYLPGEVVGPLVSLDSSRREGWFTFPLPNQLPPGHYTFVIHAVGEATGKDDKKHGAATWTNPVTIEVYPAPYLVTVDPRTPKRIARGEVIQLRYQAVRRNGFIGKIHTELRASGGLVGLRARGVTFVGGTETGVIQIIADENAPLGPVQFLHLEAIGTVEDEPIYQSGCLVELEITPARETSGRRER